MTTAQDRSRVPKYRRQKVRNRPDRAFVELNDRRVYLGQYRSAESQAEYRRVVAEWLAGGGQLPADPDQIRIVELIERYWSHVQEHYRRPDGTPTNEQSNVRQAVRPLRELYGRELVKSFGPLALRAVREKMIEAGWCRNQINKAVGRIVRMFKWATENELVHPDIWHGLQAVAGLRAGRTAARESEPVRPVPQALVDVALANTTPTVAAMIRVQLLTGMRPAELCSMRTADLDMSGPVWVYRPEWHKTQQYGHRREILIGPKAQEALRPYLKTDLTAFIFSPAQSEVERRAAMHVARKTPLSCGNRPGTNRKRNPRRQPGERFSVTDYGHSIDRAMDKAFPPPAHLARLRGEIQQDWKHRLEAVGLYAELKAWWHQHRWNPNQLRHNKATELRRAYGIDKAQTILGHRLGSQITEVYSEAARADAMDIVQQIG